MKALYIDLETTGLVTYNARICQIGLIWEHGGFTDEKSILINPMIPIPQEASKIHKITDDMVQSAQTFADIAPKLKSLFDKADIIVGYNIINYDYPILAYEFLRCGIELDQPQLVDVYKLWQQLEKRKLKDAFRRFVGEEMDEDGSHNALYDIKATKKVLEGMMKSYNFTIDDCLGL